MHTAVQSPTDWTASVLYTCPNLSCNPCSKCYGMDCFGTYFTHVQTCNVTRVESATEWTASVHTLRTSKPVMHPCSKCYGMHAGLQGHLTGEHLNRGLPGTFKGSFRGGLPGTEGLEGTFRELTGGRTLKVTFSVRSVHVG